MVSGPILFKSWWLPIWRPTATTIQPTHRVQPSSPRTDGQNGAIFPALACTPDSRLVVARRKSSPPRVELPKRAQDVGHERGRPLRGRLVGHAVSCGNPPDGLRNNVNEGQRAPQGGLGNIDDHLISHKTKSRTTVRAPLFFLPRRFRRSNLDSWKT